MEESIKNKILNLMKEQNISYGELSNRTKLSKSTLQRYITKNDSKVPIDRLKMIAQGLNTTTAYLLGWESEEQMHDKLAQMQDDVTKIFLDIRDEILKNEKLDLFEIILICSELNDDNLKTILKIVKTFKDDASDD